MNIYYVYTHSVNDEVFYVGKGRGNRATQTRSRNRHWWNIVNKHGKPVVNIIQDNLTDEDAYSLEIKLISEYGISNLSNVSEGGKLYENGYDMSGESNPMYGKTHSEETREKIRKRTLKRNKETFKHSDIQNQRISESLRGKTKSDKHKENLSKAQQRIEPQICPHCGTRGTHNMKRYHFDNCKEVNTNQERHKTGTWKGYLLVTDYEGNETQYNSMSECSKILKVDIHGISNHVKNNTTYKRGIYKGYKFKIKK